MAREPMAPSQEPSRSGASNFSASSMGADKSASVKSAISPRASSIPRRTLNPLPRLRPLEIRRSSGRSEEHTSELQSHVNLVCRLLLEKKKKNKKKHKSLK